MLAAATLPYDVVADIDGRLLKVAVKTTREPKSRPSRPGSKARYFFNIGRCQRIHTGQTLNKPYESADVDLFALVALDIRRVAYIPFAQCPRSIWIESGTAQVDRKYGPRRRMLAGFEDYPLERIGHG
jgi:hypothetical protein